MISIISAIKTKVTVRCYLKSKTAGYFLKNKTKQNKTETIDQLKLLHTAVENINYTTSWKNKSGVIRKDVIYNLQF